MLSGTPYAEHGYQFSSTASSDNPLSLLRTVHCVQQRYRTENTTVLNIKKIF